MTLTNIQGTSNGGKTLVRVRPRGFCAGVVRAVDIVELALEAYGRPVYVHHEIVHNRYVVDQLRRRGAIFVESIEEVPVGAVLVFSAHGVPPRVRTEAVSYTHLQRFYCFLTILRRVADVVRSRSDDSREPLAQARHYFLRVVERQGRLRQECEAIRVLHFESVHFLDAAHNQGLLRGFSRRSDDFLMIAMADQNQRAPFARKFKSFQVHLRHQRASGINDAQLPLLRFRAHPRWHPVSAENKHSADRNFINGFHEDCAAAPQLIHHIAVMNDFVMDVNRAAVSFEREFYDCLLYTSRCV